MRFKSYLALLALILTFSVGCGGAKQNQGASQPSQPPAQQGGLLDTIKKQGQLMVGTEGTYSPFSFHDSSGKLTGFDVDLATEVANRIGVKPMFMETQWDAMFAGLDSKRFDMIANEVGIKPDRQAKYDFSNPYISSPAVVLTRKDDTRIKDFKDIKGLKSAQSMTSNYADIAKTNGAEIVAVNGFNEAIDLLTSKRVDVTINDYLSVLDLLKKKPDTPIKIAAKSTEASPSGFMFRKGSSDLVTAVNKALDDIKKDGTYAKISEKWFGVDVSK